MRCCDLTAGKLSTPGKLQRIVKEPDGGGGWSSEWRTYAAPRLLFKPVSGSERLAAERLDAVTRNRAYMRYRPDVTESDRLVVRGRAYQIRAALDLEMRRQWLELDLDGGVAT